ncbi:MAG TPA: ABC transporter permease [Gaiellaceae bacterium]|nr:ABC transporter permease [Gaiellaceae bacterium]
MEIGAEGRRDAPPILRLLDPRPYAVAVAELVVLLFRKRTLTYEIARREIASEHTGKALGIFWGVAQPLFLLIVYAVIYGVVFKARVTNGHEFPRNFTIYLLAGLVPWFAFQLSMTRATGVIVGNANLVKEVVFDLNVLPVATAIASCLSLLLGIAFVAFLTLLDYGSVPLTYLAIPVVVFAQFLGMVGFAFALAALGTFIRDVRDLVQLSAVVLIFLMPIVYLPDAIPSSFRPVLWLNPFTYMVYCYQDVLYYGRFEHPWAWIAFLLGSLFVFAAGYRLFRSLHSFFANVV